MKDVTKKKRKANIVTLNRAYSNFVANVQVYRSPSPSIAVIYNRLASAGSEKTGNMQCKSFTEKRQSLYAAATDTTQKE